jgi:hypothetical protein
LRGVDAEKARREVMLLKMRVSDLKFALGTDAMGWFDRFKHAERERDEARAEVERLRGIAMHPTGVTWARYHENVMEIVREEAALDYKAGAEAMRKAVRRIAVREPGASQRVVELIENLPVPEDTP